MKIAAVGSGQIAAEVLPQLSSWGWELTAICSTKRSKKKAEQMSERCGGTAAVFTDLDAMLDSVSVEALYVAVPNHLHYAIVKRALMKGVNVIVEKPLASNFREASELADIARSRNLFLFEAISTLYNRNYLKIQELLPRIGEVRLVTCNFSQYSSRYDPFAAGETPSVFDPACSGGALMDLNLYNIHYLLGLFGAPRSVCYLPNMERNIDTGGVLTMDYGRFQAVSIAVKDSASPSGCCIQGTKGYLLQTTPANFCGAVTLHLNDGTEERYDLSTPSRLEPEFRRFREEISSGDTTLCYRTLDQSLDVAQLQTEARLGAGIYFPADIQYDDE